jgi:hypothetical protein
VQETSPFFGAVLCYKEKAAEKGTHDISSSKPRLYLRVPGLNINQDTNYPDLGFS